MRDDKKEKKMSDTSQPSPNGLARKLPLIVVGVVALIGAFTLKDYLTFQTLADNREALLAFRDANFALTVLAFVTAYAIIVGF
jgi:hypothetical protein